VRGAVQLGLVLLALLVSAWFGLGWYQASRAGRADALIARGSSLSAGQAHRAAALLDSAGTLNPDRAVTISRARLAADEGHFRLAVRLLRSVTQEEPENLTAWVQLVFVAAKAGDHKLAALGGREVSTLIPKVRESR
jgi:predicted Zn-dependent protease